MNNGGWDDPAFHVDRRHVTFYVGIGGVAVLLLIAVVVLLARRHDSTGTEGYRGGRRGGGTGFGAYARPGFWGGGRPGRYRNPYHWLYYKPMYYFGQPDYNHFHWWRYPYGYYYGPWARPTMFDASHEKELCLAQCGNALDRCTASHAAGEVCEHRHDGCTEGCDRDARWFAY